LRGTKAHLALEGVWEWRLDLGFGSGAPDAEAIFYIFSKK